MIHQGHVGWDLADSHSQTRCVNQASVPLYLYMFVISGPCC